MNMYHVRQNYRDNDVAVANCGSGRHLLGPRAGQRGFSLIELLITMSIGMIILGGVYGVFLQQQKQFSNQEVAVEMQQNARMAMDIMTRDIRMAGYNPTFATPKPGMITAGANTITFEMDITNTNDDGLKQPDGFTDGPNEYRTYDLYTPAGGTQYLARKSTSNAVRQPVVEHVDQLNFSYFDANGAATATLANIRMIRVTIRVIAAKADPLYTTNGGFRTYTLVSDIRPRNLGL